MMRVNGFSSRLMQMIAGAAFLGSAVLAPVAEGQLDFLTKRSGDGTKVYLSVTHANNNDQGIGIADVAINSIAVSIPAAALGCSFIGNNTVPNEAWASVPQTTSLPIAQVRRSGLITDASTVMFDGAANGGAGAMCIGGGCDGTCTASATCSVVTFAGMTDATVASGGVPAMGLFEPISIAAPDADQCEAASRASYLFGQVADLDVLIDLCDVEAPAGTLRLPSATSTLGGADGTTIIFAFDIETFESLNLAVAGFGVGVNAGVCGDGDLSVLNSVAIQPNVPGLLPTATPTSTPTDTPTNTPTATPTDTPTNTPTATNTPTNTPTLTNTPTNTPTDTPTATPSDTPTNTPTRTPTATVTNTRPPIPVVSSPFAPSGMLMIGMLALALVWGMRRISTSRQ